MITFSHTQKLEAWAGGKHAVIWLDGDMKISDKFMAQIKRELVDMLKQKGAIILAYEWQDMQGSPKPLCLHCHERVALPKSDYCPFCHGWALQHGGELPPDDVLSQKEANRKFTPKKHRANDPN